MKKLLFLFLALAGGWATQAQVFTQTYTAGDIYGTGAVQTSTNQVSPCPGIVTFTGLPAGANVDSVRVVYDFFSTLLGFQSPFEQRSYLNCPTTGNKEVTLALAPPVGPGVTTVTYDRIISIANGPLTSSTLTFELHAGTTSLIPGSCTGSGHIVLNNTFTITVYISGSANCPQPSTVTTTSTTNSIDFDWTPGGSESQWQFVVGPQGFPLNSGLPSLTTVHPVTISGLDSASHYDFYVRALCGPGDTSIWTGPFTAMTDTPFCDAPINGSASNVTETEATISWGANGNPIEWELEYGPQGFTLGSGTFIPSAQSNPWILQGLTPNTDYEVYVRSQCGLNVSDWHGPIGFTTLDPSVGLAEYGSELQPYPNPTAGNLNIESNLERDYEIRDAQGKVVASGHLAVGRNNLNLTNLSNGWYVLTSGTLMYPIILNR